jgi:GTP-binding protein
MGLPLVAIVGAPNVGKSTLYNRLVGGRPAIVSDEPGVTRDRLYGEVLDAVRPFRLVDTGGITLGTEMPLAQEVEQQARVAVEEAALVLFVVDARAGVSGLDEELATQLMRRGVRPLLVANKVDGAGTPIQLDELHALGLGDPIPISAEHGRGVGELLDLMAERLPAGEERDGERNALNIAIVGRPNVGKSSIVNRLLGEERVLVSDIPGTTRDAIDTLLEVGERRYRLIDTAGLRRPGRIRHNVERTSVARARENIRRCDVAVLVLDGSEPIAAQDTHVAGHALEALKPILVVVNKWDLVDEREQAVKDWEEQVRHRLRFTRGAPILFASALTGQRIVKILDIVDEIHRHGAIKVPTTELNRWLQAQLHAARRNSRGPGFRLLYATQSGIHPPSFILFCNDPQKAHFSTRRQIENSLRASFGFGSVPLRLEFRGRRREDRE